LDSESQISALDGVEVEVEEFGLAKVRFEI
jgi:hypothetical protein